MSLDALLGALTAYGVRLSVRDGALVLNGAVGDLPPELLQALRARKTEFIEQYGTGSERLHQESCPASFGQARLAFLNALQPGSAAYNVAASLVLRGPCDLDTLLRAFACVVSRHRALRTHLQIREGQAFARVAGNSCAFPSVVDISDWPPQAARSEIERLRLSAASTGFDLTVPPLWRCVVIRRGECELEVVVAIHHFIADGWSLARALRELAIVYACLAEGRQPALPALQAEYADYAAWEKGTFHSAHGQSDLQWWHDVLAGSEVPIAFPSDRRRPAVLSDRGGRIAFSLDIETTRRLRRFAAERGATVTAVISAVHAVLLHRFSGSERFLIAVAVSNRPRESFHGVVGFFVNWLPVSADFSADPGFADFFTRWEEARLCALRHQYTPFDAIAREMRRDADLSRHPLFQHMVVSHVPARKVRFGDVSVSIDPLPTGTTKLDMTLFMTDSAGAVPVEGHGEIFLEIEYSTDLFERRTVETLGEAFVALLDSALSAPQTRLGALSLVSSQIASNLDSIVRGGPARHIASALLLIRDRAAEQPNAPAVVHDGGVISYDELWARANSIAGVLRAAGVGEGSRVGILLPRTPDLLAAVIGVPLCRASFVPLDAMLPEARLTDMILDCDPAVILTSTTLEPTARRIASDRRLLCVEDVPVRSTGECPDWAAEIGPGDHAYILYTSGSTGRPKGVMGLHGPLANFTGWLNTYLGCESHDRVLCKTPLGFDASLREIVAPLCAGAVLVLAGDEAHADPAALAHMIERHGVTILHATPTMYREVLAAMADRGGEGGARGASVGTSLRHVMCGGEVLDGALTAAHFRAHAMVRLHNVYGPTECTIDVTVHEVLSGGEPAPLGRPIPGAIVYVAGPDLSPVPPGAAGEIVIAGVPLTAGYWQRPDEQRARFVIPPAGMFAGEQVYRTGDRGHYSSAGLLFYDGRIDRQVKVRGARVELAEIERVLLQQPGVVAAVVTLRPYAGDSRALVGFVQLDAAVPDSAARIECLRTVLAERLPRYMQPAAIACVEKFPRLSTGKTDVDALEASWRPPETSVPAAALIGHEALVAELMAQILERPILSADTDFFRAGGHSLSAVRLIGRIARRCNVVITVRELFENRTVAGLAALLALKTPRSTDEHPPREEISRSVRPRGIHA